MTVHTNATIERYLISGPGPYAFTFRIFEPTDLAVTALSNAVPPVSVVLSYLTHYTVAGANDQRGGSVTLTSAAASTFARYTLDIRSNTPTQQRTQFRNQSRFLPDIHEDALDNLSRQIQDIKRQLRACVRYPDIGVNDAAMAPLSNWLSRYLTVGPTGVLEPAELTTSGALTQSIVGGLLFPQTDAESRAGVTPVNSAHPPGNILRYGADPSGAVSADTAGQAMLDQRAQGGAPCHVPSGTYKQTVTWTYPPSTVSLVLYGDGMGSSIITTAANIESLTNAGASATHGLSNPHVRDIAFHNTFPVKKGAGATHFHVHLKNPLNARIERVYCKSAFVDTDFHVDNHAGIWLERVEGWGAAFQNLISQCWIQNGQINIGTSDSEVTRCIAWGHPCDYCIKVDNGNIAVRGNYDLAGSRSHGAVWLTTNATNCRVQGNFFDGANAAIQSGYGVYGDQQLSNSVTDNIFWTTQLAGVWLNNPIVWTVSDNIFLNCGTADRSVDDSDIVINAIAFASNNLIHGNQCFRTEVRKTACFAIYEKSSGAVPGHNRMIGNNVLGTGTQYAHPAISVAAGLFAGGSVLIGNTGNGIETECYSAPANALTLTGCTTAPRVTPRITRQGNLVQIYVPAVSAKSNSTHCKLTGLPEAVRPANTARGSCVVQNSGNDVAGFWTIDKSGDITLSVVTPTTGVADAAGFLNDNRSKGVVDGLTLIYPLI